MKNTVDMKKLIENWKNSVKYAEFQLKKKQFRNKLRELNDRVMEEWYYMTEEELERVLDLLIEVYSNQEIYEEPEIFDDFTFTFGSPEEVIIEHTNKLSVWYIYLLKMCLQEKYEIASKIKKVILLEKKDFLRLIKFFRFDLYSDSDFIEAFELSYETYDNLIIEKLGI